MMREVITKAFGKLFGFCGCCETWFNKDIKRRRLNTEYANDESNYMTSCKYCYDEQCSYYQEL